MKLRIAMNCGKQFIIKLKQHHDANDVTTKNVTMTPVSIQLFFQISPYEELLMNTHVYMLQWCG
jgi:hypothetical protein